MLLKVLILSVLQGVAEFLPISSSGHLVLGKDFLGLDEAGIRLDIALHMGTLLAVFAFYWMVIVRIVRNFEWSYVLKILLSAVPAGIVGVLFKDQLEELFSSSLAVGIALMCTGVMLTATRFLGRGEKSVTFLSAIWMGLAQAVAILPGVSRSGSTLVAARLSKIDAEKAAEFSFLMSAPPIAGAALLEILKSFKGAEASGAEISWGLCALGAAVSAVVGFAALKLLLKSLKSDKFWLFGPYCLAAGFLAVVLSCCR